MARKSRKSSKKKRRGGRLSIKELQSRVGKKAGMHFNNINEMMAWVRSQRGKKKKASGGKFPKGSPADWARRAKQGDPVAKRALKNWHSYMAKYGRLWNAHKAQVIGGSLPSPVDYKKLIKAFRENHADDALQSGGAIRGAAIRGYGRKGCGGAIRGYGMPITRPHCSGGAIRGYGIVDKDFLQRVQKAFDRRLNSGMISMPAKTKRDLYRSLNQPKSGGHFNSWDKRLERKMKKYKPFSSIKSYHGKRFLPPTTPKMPLNPLALDLPQQYREVYKNSGVRRETPQAIENHTLPTAGGGIRRKLALKGIRKYISGGGLIEEGPISGKGHDPMIYH